MYVWRLAANGLERTALAKMIARSDAIAKYVPLPDELQNFLQIETYYQRLLAEARRAFPSTTFNLRLGVPRQLEPPPHSYAPGDPRPLQECRSNELG